MKIDNRILESSHEVNAGSCVLVLPGRLRWGRVPDKVGRDSTLATSTHSVGPETAKHRRECQPGAPTYVSIYSLLTLLFALANVEQRFLGKPQVSTGPQYSTGCTELFLSIRRRQRPTSSTDHLSRLSCATAGLQLLKITAILSLFESPP